MFEVGLGARKSTHRLNIDIVNPFTFLKKKIQYCDSILGLYLNRVRFQLIYRYKCFDVFFCTCFHIMVMSLNTTYASN